MIVAGPGFVTASPVGWHETRRGALVELASRGSLDRFGIPRPGAIGITLGTFTIAALPAATPHPASANAIEIAPVLVTVPSGVTAFSVRSAFVPAAIGGVTGVGLVFSYELGGIGNVQRDVVVRDGGRVAFAEADTRPELARRAAAALAAVLRAWRWRR